MYFEDRDDYYRYLEQLHDDGIDPLEDEKYDRWKDDQAINF